MKDKADMVLWVLILAVVVGLSGAIAKGQTTCDLKFTASLGGCDNVYTNWFTRRTGDTGTTLYYTDLLGGSGDHVIQLPAGARSYSLTGVGCSAHYDIVAVMTFAGSPTVCTANLHDNHNRPCDQCAAVSAPASIAHAASYRATVAPGSIATLFSTEITTSTASASSLPLPSVLAGVQVFIGPSLTQCPLFFASPNQINFIVPADTPQGLVNVRATNSEGKSFFGDVFVSTPAPGIFTRDGTGGGLAAGVWLVARITGQQSYYNLGGLPTLNAGDRAFLVLYGTGFAGVNSAVLYLGNGRQFSSIYAGAAPGFAGLDQITFPIATGDLWTGTLGAVVRIPVGSGYTETQGFELRK